jgi:hypothetical protein
MQAQNYLDTSGNLVASEQTGERYKIVRLPNGDYKRIPMVNTIEEAGDYIIYEKDQRISIKNKLRQLDEKLKQLEDILDHALPPEQQPPNH